MLLDIIKYFAQYVPSEVMLELFDKNKLNDPLYDELKTYVASLTNPVLPNIDKIIISQDEDDIKEIVGKSNGFIMMIEHGIIQGEAPNQMGIRKMKASLSVIIAHHFNESKCDAMSAAVIMHNCLSMLNKIVQTMTEDSTETTLKDYASESITIAPLGQGEGSLGLYESIGYVMSFNINNKDW